MMFEMLDPLDDANELAIDETGFVVRARAVGELELRRPARDLRASRRGRRGPQLRDRSRAHGRWLRASVHLATNAVQYGVRFDIAFVWTETPRDEALSSRWLCRGAESNRRPRGYESLALTD